MPTSHRTDHHHKACCHHLAKSVILPIAKRELLTMWGKGIGIHKKGKIIFSHAQAGRMARIASKHMKGGGFWSTLKNIGSSVLKRFSNPETLRKIFLSPDVLQAAITGLASGDPLEALGDVGALVAKNVGQNLLEGIGEGAEGGHLVRHRSRSAHRSRSRSAPRSRSLTGGRKHSVKRRSSHKRSISARGRTPHPTHRRRSRSLRGRGVAYGGIME